MNQVADCFEALPRPTGDAAARVAEDFARFAAAQPPPIKACRNLVAHTSLPAGGKLSATERIGLLIDNESDFLELSALAGFELYDTSLPRGGIICGIGLVSGRLCMIVASEPQAKGGAYFPITVKKHLRAQEIALKNALPCIYLVESAGAFLPLQADVFPDRDHFGRIFYNQAQMSARGIAQIAVVHGWCTAGGAYVPAMADHTIMVRGQGKIFLAGPPLVAAATGEQIDAENLGGTEVHVAHSGLVDYAAADDGEALQIVRQLVRTLRPDPARLCAQRQPASPDADPGELRQCAPNRVRSFSVRQILSRLLDGSELFEFKPRYGRTLVCGHAHLGGIPVGVIANDGILFSECATKGSQFIQLCCRDAVPLLFIQNVTGFMVGSAYEKGGIAKHGACLVRAVAGAEVPKITVIAGASYGAGNYGMCGRAYDPDFLFTWPSSEIAVMGSAQAASVLTAIKQAQLARRGETLTLSQQEEITRPVQEQVLRESRALHATARLWDDGILAPEQTRRTLILAFSACLARSGSVGPFGPFRL